MNVLQCSAGRCSAVLCSVVFIVQGNTGHHHLSSDPTFLGHFTTLPLSVVFIVCFIYNLPSDVESTNHHGQITNFCITRSIILPFTENVQQGYSSSKRQMEQGTINLQRGFANCRTIFSQALHSRSGLSPGSSRKDTMCL